MLCIPSYSLDELRAFIKGNGIQSHSLNSSHSPGSKVPVPGNSLDLASISTLSFSDPAVASLAQFVVSLSEKVQVLEDRIRELESESEIRPSSEGISPLKKSNKSKKGSGGFRNKRTRRSASLTTTKVMKKSKTNR